MKNKFNCILMSLALCFIFSNAVAQAEPNRFTEHSDKVKLIKADNTTACGNLKGVSLSWQNVSSEPVDLQYAIERPGGSWHVRTVLNVQPNAKVENIIYCKGTGVYKWWARPSRETAARPFPSLEKIKAGTY